MERLRPLVAWALILLAAALSLAVFLAYLGPRPVFNATLDLAHVSHEEGHSYIVQVTPGLPIGYSLASDGPRGPNSNLVLRENGKPLGPAHSWHVDIRQSGNGRYSHWSGWLRFSASDNSDPLANGRTYTIAAVAQLHPLVLPAVILFDLAVIAGLRRRIQSAPRFRRGCIDAALAMVVVVAALLAIGILPGSDTGFSSQGELVPGMLAHAFLGYVIAAAHWLAGAGVARLLRPRHVSVPDVLLAGFAIGLPVTAALSAIALTLPGGPFVAVVLWILCCAPLLRWRPPSDDIRDIVRTALATAPVAMGLGCWLGLLWHGPTGTLSGSTLGDIVYYATSITSLALQPYPHLHLGYERETFHTYFNLLFPAIGAALSRALPLDPLKFIPASGAAFFVLSIGVALRLYASSHLRTANSGALLIVGLSILVATRDPSWMVESIPMIFVLPLTLAVAHLARARDTATNLFAVGVAVAGSALSKVVAITVLAPFAGAPLLRRFSILGPGMKLASVGVAIAAGVYLLLVVFRLGPAAFQLFDYGPSSIQLTRISGWPWDMAFPFYLRDVSALMMAVTAFFVADVATAAAIALGFVLFLIYPALFFVDFSCAALLLALCVSGDDDRQIRLRYLLAASLTLALPAALFSGPTGPQTGVVLFLSLGGAVWIALSQQNPIAWSLLGRATAASAISLCLLLVSVERGHLVVSPSPLYETRQLTPEVREVWLRVDALTPPDALVFTDQTGSEFGLLAGYNTYAFIGRRQIFISSPFVSPKMRADTKLLAEVLKENERVLEGVQQPSKLSLSRRYSSFFAVVNRKREVPNTWSEVFANKDYVLYQIPDVSTGSTSERQTCRLAGCVDAPQVPTKPG